MILESPVYLALLGLAVGIVLLHFLNTRRRRHEVSTLLFWQGSPNDPRPRASRMRVRVDASLLLQLLVLAGVVLALAEPSFRMRRPHIDGLAIVLDGSASLRARSPEGAPVAELCRKEALSLLARYPTTPVAVLELTESPRVLAPLSRDHESARRAIADWEPTWFANGSAEDLLAVLGVSEEPYERIVLLTDASPPFVLPNLDVLSFPAGGNVAITAFSVRDDPSSGGAIAFARVRNGLTADYQGALRVSDGTRRTSVTVYLPSGDEQDFVIPFPASRGPLFTAEVEGGDAFPADDSRQAGLARPTEWRIRVVGEADRYLRAALSAVGRVTFLAAGDPASADLTVVCGASIPEGTSGGVLLVHASFPETIVLGEDEETASAVLAVDAPDDPLLAGVDPLDFVIRRSPPARPYVEGTTLVSLGGNPLLWRADLPGRRVVLLAADPLETNLPLCVDFPILVWNAVRWLSLTNPSAPPANPVVGEPVPFSPYGVPERLEDPAGREIEVTAGSAGFVARAPGIYRLTTSSGTFAVAVNVPWDESPRRDPSPPQRPQPPASDATELGAAFFRAWPAAAGLALVCLVLEAALCRRAAQTRRRT